MRLFLFDIDGTLISSDGAGRRALGRALDEVLDIEQSLDGVVLAGRTDPLILKEVATKAGLDEQFLVDRQSAIVTRYLALLETELAQSAGYQVLPGVRSLLSELHALDGSGLALGTGNIEPGARLKLAHGGIDHFFPTGGFGSDASDRPGLIRAGIKKSRRVYQSEFEQIWIIGDTPADIQAARAVGAKVIAVASGGIPSDELQNHAPDLLLETLSDPRALETLLT